MDKLESREAFGRFKKRRIKPVLIPGEGMMWIRSMSELERSRFELYFTELAQSNGNRSKAFEHFRARKIQFCLVREDGKRIFSDDTEDTKEILQWDSLITDVLSDAIEEHTGARAPTEEEQAALEKKLETTPAAGLPT